MSQEIRSILLIADLIRGRENDPSHIDGLQPSVLSQRNGFIPVQHKAIQIHHVPGHWVTSSSTGRNLAVYDSKFTGGDLSSSLTPSICRLLAERMRMEMILTPQC